MRVWEKIVLVALCGLLPACTVSQQFEFEEPKAEVTLDGALQSGSSDGQTYYWGKARNTGDLDVQDVVFVIEVYGAGGEYLGRFSGIVSRGLEGDIPANDLKAGESGPSSGECGDFTIFTTVPWGAAARTEYHAEFTEVIPEETS